MAAFQTVRPHLWMVGLSALVASHHACGSMLRGMAIFLGLSVPTVTFSIMARRDFERRNKGPRLNKRYETYIWIALFAGIGSAYLNMTPLHATVLWVVITGIGWTVASIMPNQRSARRHT